MALSPMMEAYLRKKEEYPDCILFYRLGDFYEMFFDDAVTCSKELGLTLTGKDCGLPERAPMCGVPFHAVDSYLPKLVMKGYKVAIAEQMEDPKNCKGLVPREVIRVVTPGTLTDSQALDETKNHYIMAAIYERGVYGLSFSDVSTGAFYTTEVSGAENVIDEIVRFEPSEILVNAPFLLSGCDLSGLRERMGFSQTTLEDPRVREEACEKLLLRHFEVHSLESLGLSSASISLLSSGALLSYLLDTQKTELKHINRIEIYSNSKFMSLDASTRRNLELTETMREKQKRGSLLSVLDRTKTAMGARYLRKFIEQPLLDRGEILRRQGAVSEFFEDGILREELREYLKPVYDLERLIGRVSYKTANPRDLLAFQKSLEMVPHIKTILHSVGSDLLKELRDSLDELTDITKLISDSICEDAPVMLHEGGIIAPGFHEEIDRYRKAKSEGKTWLSEVENEEREKTGIKTLKIKYNKVFGYYLEVTNSFKDQVPSYFERKQTLSGAERYITPRLKELEDIILGAEDKLNVLEFEIFKTVRDAVAGEILRIQKTAHALSMIDALLSLGVVAAKNHYVCPKINEKGRISIKDGRHPVIEQLLHTEPFVPNDTKLDTENNRMIIITGPNMAGKSTYMRQTALISLMAQIGSFVPASSADICISDRIFTRVGASDDLASGRSTFMVEMTEVSNILRNATKQSLIILDEIGRGTSTFDGLSIAWAVVEYLQNAKKVGAKTLFATHYHELTELPEFLPGTKNYSVSVLERDHSIVFLRKIVEGPADKSYGVQVARLAGLPAEVLSRAEELLSELSETDLSGKARELASYAAIQNFSRERVKKQDDVDRNQFTMLETVKDTDVLEEIKKLELQKMTPIDAMNMLYKLQSELLNRI